MAPAFDLDPLQLASLDELIEDRTDPLLLDLVPLVPDLVAHRLATGRINAPGGRIERVQEHPRSRPVRSHDSPRLQ